MYYILIIGTLLFVANSCAMETTHQSFSPLTVRLALCAETNSDFLRDQMDRIPPSPEALKRYRHLQKIVSYKSKPGPQQPFLELPKQKQEKLLEEHLSLKIRQ